MSKKKKPAPAKAGLRKRFMVRCSPEQWARWKLEAAQRGFARGTDSGVGRLVGHVMDGRILTGAQIALGTRAGEALSRDLGIGREAAADEYAQISDAPDSPRETVADLRRRAETAEAEVARSTI